MKASLPVWLERAWVALRSSFWFIPSIMVACALGLAAFMIHLDHSVGEGLADKFATLFGANASGARSILAAVASSMITVAGVTFSITIVALSLASNQYTPRILRNFMRDLGNQLVLGVFVSVFVYCLLVLRAIRGGDDSFIPSLSLVVGIGLGILAIGFLIYFVHHIANMVQASTILANIYHETRSVIEDLYPKSDQPLEEPPEGGGVPPEGADSTAVLSERTGYLQDVDHARLIQCAEEVDGAFELACAIGAFVAAGAPLGKMHGAQQLPEEVIARVTGAFSISQTRTIEQDPSFGFRQIVDVALKALSPGINDTTTAVSCVDYLGALLFHLAERRIPSYQHCAGGRLRLIACGPTYAALAGAAFSEIRQHTARNVSLYIKLLEAAAKAAPESLDEEKRDVLWEQAVAVAGQADRLIDHPADRALINEALAKAASHLRRDFRPHSLSGGGEPLQMQV